MKPINQILQHLKDGNTLTVADGMRMFRTNDVRKNIFVLRSKGIDIKDRWIKKPSGVRFKEYFL